MNMNLKFLKKYADEMETIGFALKALLDILGVSTKKKKPIVAAIDALQETTENVRQAVKRGEAVVKEVKSTVKAVKTTVKQAKTGVKSVTKKSNPESNDETK